MGNVEKRLKQWFYALSLFRKGGIVDGNTGSRTHPTSEDHQKLFLVLDPDPKPGESFVKFSKTLPSYPLRSSNGRADPLSDDGFIRSET